MLFECGNVENLKRLQHVVAITTLLPFSCLRIFRLGHARFAPATNVAVQSRAFCRLTLLSGLKRACGERSIKCQNAANVQFHNSRSAGVVNSGSSKAQAPVAARAFLARAAA